MFKIVKTQKGWLLLGIILLSAGLIAAFYSPDGTETKADAFSSAGGRVSSTNFETIFIAGQSSPPGVSESSNFRNIGGFLTPLAFHIGKKGDINKDGEVDIFDLVKLINFILEKVEPTPYEFWAGDINDDSELDIFDVVKMINIILEGDSTALTKMAGSPAQIGELSLPDVELKPEHTTEVPVNANFDGTVAGIQLVLHYNPQILKLSTPNLTSRTEQMELATADKDGKLTILIYSSTGHVIEAGDGAILNFTVQALSGFKGATQLEIDEVIVVDVNAEAISVDFFIGNIAAAKPKAYFLAQNYPNPFNAQTMIKYQLPKSDRVVLKIYNNLGQEIRTLVDDEQEAGYYTINWDGRNNEGIRVSSGIYIYRIQAGDFVRVKKMLFVM